EIEVVTARAEDQARLGKYREAFDIVTARAVTQLAALAELTLPFCIIGGRCILPKKGDTAREIEEAGKAVETLGGTIVAIQNIDLEGLDDNRHLVVLEKTAPTPDKYPRRSGMPEKRPIK
ncbi:MAG: 16S rRNA (guanine(527)-N(7))-methyltransferase RsmG, partial [Dehalococcoidales bacterium]|nr:16S rRNA (guanine(527)-N(7))-methyltransferase RsmG [Dehalococcoidales bacterium]